MSLKAVSWNLQNRKIDRHSIRDLLDQFTESVGDEWGVAFLQEITYPKEFRRKECGVL